MRIRLDGGEVPPTAVAADAQFAQPADWQALDDLSRAALLLALRLRQQTSDAQEHEQQGVVPEPRKCQYPEEPEHIQQTSY